MGMQNCCNIEKNMKQNKFIEIEGLSKTFKTKSRSRFLLKGLFDIQKICIDQIEMDGNCTLTDLCILITKNPAFMNEGMPALGNIKKLLKSLILSNDMLTRRKAIHNPLHKNIRPRLLSDHVCVPCVICPLKENCVLKGTISPEECVYLNDCFFVRK